MKRFLLLQMLLGLVLMASAANTKRTVGQVTEPVTLTDDVDFHITSSDPFATTGSIDIVNTEHAVVFLDEVKPRKAISYLAFIKINGEAARNNQNCQIRIFNQGALILPYGTAGALTVYSEPNFQGESANNFNFGNSGGFMQNLSDAQLKNRIKSFKLKRGYMVTFAIGELGRGYSRCFIADTEDLEFAELPAIRTAALPPTASSSGKTPARRVLPTRVLTCSTTLTMQPGLMAGAWETTCCPMRSASCITSMRTGQQHQNWAVLTIAAT